jgi:hypothetical protein
MISDIQNIKLETKIIEPIEIKIRIPKNGEVKPLKTIKMFSGFPKIEVIQTFTTTNYVPGKITFGKNEE